MHWSPATRTTGGTSTASTSASTDIARPADDVLALVLDVEAYRAVDPRLASIRWVRRGPDWTVFRFRPSLMGLPAPPSTQTVSRHGDRVEIRALPSLADHVAHFEGELRCEDLGDDTCRATRTLSFDLRPPFRALLERRLQHWLDEDVPAEMARLRAHLEVGVRPR